MAELDQLRTPEEVGAAIQRDPRLGSWEVSLAAPGIVDLVCEAGRVLIAWPEVWSDPETLRKLTSGHGELLILVGEDLFDGHKVLCKLGQGGMGTVYKARNLASGDVVAVKTLKPEHVQSDRAIAMFLRESQLGSQLDHPNITKVYGSGYSHGVFYFLMEFVDGPDAQQYMLNEGRVFAVEDAFFILLYLRE